MKKISEYLFLWGIGGWIYYTLEILFRGFSHWSMFVLGGICMMFFSYQGQQVHWQDDFLLQVFRCSIFVTAAEFITGIIVINGLHFMYGITAVCHFSCLVRYVCRTPCYLHVSVQQGSI